MEAPKMKQHENLVGTNNLIVRQNRFEADSNIHAEINGKRFNVLNFSVFGLALQLNEDMPLESVIDNVNIYCAGHLVATLSFIVKRSKLGTQGWEIGLEAINDSLPVTSIMRLKDFSTLINNLNEKADHYRNLPVGFKLILSDLCHRFEQFEKYTKSFSDVEFANSREFEEAKEALINTVSSQIKRDLDQSLIEMVNSFKLEKSDDYKAAFSYFREKMGRYMFQSPFTKRSYEKPRGYAGDYLMMTQIYANDSHASSLFGSCMEKAIQQFGEPSAVRNRSSYLSRKIISKVKAKNGNLNILSVASGPAEEVRLSIAVLDQDTLDRCTFTLLDQDEAALQFAQKTILEFAFSVNKKVKLKLVNRGIKEILVAGLEQSNYDLVYSAGLFDYFTDAVASRACKMLSRHMAADGQLVIGNFNVETTNWFGMLAFFDWSLILRGEADFRRLFSFDNNQITIESEDNRINLFCCITK